MANPVMVAKRQRAVQQRAAAIRLDNTGDYMPGVKLAETGYLDGYSGRTVSSVHKLHPVYRSAFVRGRDWAQRNQREGSDIKR
jgi:hypothetical protein